MHEEALVRDLRHKLEDLARTHGGVRIVRVRVAVGALSHLDERRLRDLWPRVMGTGAAANAALEVETLADPQGPAAMSIVLRSVTFDDGDGSPGVADAPALPLTSSRPGV